MKVLLAHYQEIALKGQNRPWFIRHLARNLRDALAGLDVGDGAAADGPHRDRRSGRRPTSTRPAAGSAPSAAWPTSPWPAPRAPDVDGDHRGGAARSAARPRVVPSFRVEVRRAHKQFPVSSPDARARHRQPRPGRDRLDGRPVRSRRSSSGSRSCRRRAYYYFDKEPGAGGLPVGTGGRVLVLLSGGIDSPVAAWRMIRRGCHATFVHFHGHPFTSRASIDKVRELVRVLAPYQLGAHVMFVPFGELQRQVTMAVPAAMRVVVYRRLMMRIAASAGRTVHAHALVTGDVVGQVASQTLDNLAVDRRRHRRCSPSGRWSAWSKEEIIAEAVRARLVPDLHPARRGLLHALHAPAPVDAGPARPRSRRAEARRCRSPRWSRAAAADPDDRTRASGRW